MTATERCPFPDCDGVIEETGFCGECGRRPRAASPEAAPATGSAPGAVPVPPGAPGDLLPSRESQRSSIQADAGWEPSLPVFDFPDPSSRILSRPDVPERERWCRGCGEPVGRARGGRPPRDEGYCGSCGQWYSFLPSLDEGDLVAGRYRVKGYFARGGMGWVYLAQDTHLDDNLVVLKGLVGRGDSALAALERRTLNMLDHQNIVRIFDFVSHPHPRTGEPHEYIVMEYVDGLVLEDIRARAAAHEKPLGEPLRVEHIIACGLQILSALDYLHGRGMLYCDLKPANVIVRPGLHGERGNRVRLIDLGAARRIGDRTSPVVYTEGFLDREEVEAGLTVRSDIRTLGVTLDLLYRVTIDWTEKEDGTSPVAAGLESFQRLIARARRAVPERRFASAAEMADQLRGVYREIASLRDGMPRPATSPRFTPASVLLDAGLGTVPPLARWTGDAPRTGGVARPDPAAAAAALPVPRVDPGDPEAGLLAAAADLDARRLLDRLSGHDSVEVWFARCRAHLELGDPDGARDSLDRARALLGGAADHDWRTRWHQGLLALARGDVAGAEGHFDAVYGELPGEQAPRLALGYCAEARGAAGAAGDPANPLTARAERHYQAVWRRDDLAVSAAFGLARIRLAQGDRTGAVRLLDGVPRISRHAEAAAIAQVLIRAEPLDGHPPAPDDLADAAARLARLGPAGGEVTRGRLTAVVREAAFDWIRRNGRALPASGEAFGDTPGEGAVRRLLERSYRELAEQARDAETRAVLVDLAHRIRPKTLL